MSSPFSKPIFSATGAVASIIPAESAPEMSPKVQTVFFMESQSPFENFCHRGGDFQADQPLLSSFFRMILPPRRENPALGGCSRNQAGVFAELHGLGAAFRAKFVEHPARVRLYRALADKQTLGDFAVAEPGGDQAQNLQFARSDAQLGDALLIGLERAAGRRGLPPGGSFTG